MKSCIVRRSDNTSCTLQLDPLLKRKMGEVGATAERILNGQDPTLWAQASEPNFLKEIDEGSRVMRTLSICNPDIIEVKFEQAYNAFGLCCLLAAQSGSLTPSFRAVLADVMDVWLECCPVSIRVTFAPPFDDLDGIAQQNSAVIRHYPALEQLASLVTQPYLLSLADAIALFNGLSEDQSFKLALIKRELEAVTEGARQALTDLNQGK